MATGIYAIENTLTGMVYLGQAMNTERRWITHITELNAGRHGNRHLQAAWKENGAGAFKFSVLENCTTDVLTEREQHYLDTYMPLGFCYNIVRKAIKPATGIRGHQKPAPKPDDYIDPSSLDDIEKLIVKVHRLGGNIRVAFLLAAMAETDEEFNELVQDIQKYLARKAA